MRRKTKNRLKRLFGIALAVALAVGFNPCQAAAAESVMTLVLTETSELPDYDDPNVIWTTASGGTGGSARALYLVDCSIGMGYSSQGLSMSFVTGCSEEAAEIGVSDVKVQKKVGIFWSTVASGAGSYEENSYDYGATSLYPNTEYGSTYRVSCRHYAYVDGTYIYLDNETDGHKCTY